MQQIVAGILAAVLSVAPIQAAEKASAGGQTERITVTGELAKLENKNWIGLTNKQMLEDLDYLYQTLEENYPYFEVGKRMSGVGLKANYPEIRKQMEQCTSDMDFFLLLDNWLRKDGAQAGHLGVLLPGVPEAYGPMYHEADPGSPYDTVYTNKDMLKSYKGFGELFNPVFHRVMALHTEDNESSEQMELPPNVETKILEPGKIAYVNIRSFDMESYDTDGKILKNFYKEVSNYNHLIIDISENGGGGMAYYDDLIFMPNLSKPVSWSFYTMFKNGPMIQEFLDTDELLKESWCEKAEAFPQFSGFHREDLQDVDYFWKTDMSVQPDQGQKPLFQGKIWMLVSGNVYSSSEWAAMVSKATGFATLVGTQTGGDGIGTDPIPVLLPNSKLLVRFSPIYGVTAEGLGSEEYGTTPDIISPEGETPLETCLKAIAEQK